MSRTAERVRRCFRVGECADGVGTVLYAYSGGASFEFVYRYSERGSEYRRVVVHLFGKPQLFAAFHRDWHAEHATRVFEHEIHLFGRDFFCGHDEVAFVFAVFVVHHDYEFAFAEVLDCLLDAVKSDFFAHFCFRQSGVWLM